MPDFYPDGSDVRTSQYDVDCHVADWLDDVMITLWPSKAGWHVSIESPDRECVAKATFTSLPLAAIKLQEMLDEAAEREANEWREENQ